jgi:hypothetical protein
MSIGGALMPMTRHCKPFTRTATLSYALQPRYLSELGSYEQCNIFRQPVLQSSLLCGSVPSNHPMTGHGQSPRCTEVHCLRTLSDTVHLGKHYKSLAGLLESFAYSAFVSLL